MSRDGDNGDRAGRDADLGATEEMPAQGPLSSRRRLAPAAPPAPAPAARPSEPVQLARGQSSGESQAAYATGPKTIPPSRHSAGSDPAPAVIVDGAQAHTYEPLETPPPSSSRGGLYLAPVPAFPPSAPTRGGTVPMAPAFSAPQFAAPPPPMRGRSRSETVVITMPGRKRGPSSREKVLAFVVVLVIVALLGIIFLLWRGLEQRRAGDVQPEPASAPVVVEAKPTVEVVPTPPPPPVAVVVAPAMMIDAGAKKVPKRTH